MSEARTSVTRPSVLVALSEEARLESRDTSPRAQFLTKLLVSFFLSIAFLAAAAVAFTVWYFKTRTRKRAEAIEMQKMEDAAGSLEAERVRIQEHRASTLATLEGRIGEKIVTERAFAW